MKPLPKAFVILTPAFPADETETSWVTTQQSFVRLLQAQYPGLVIKVLSFYYPDKISSYQWNGLAVNSFGGTKDRKLRRVLFWRRVWRHLDRIRREYEIAGLLSFWCGECALVAHYYSVRHGIQHQCWLCGQDARESNKLVKFIRPRPSELVAMSDFLVEEFGRHHGIRPACMIPNGIDPSAYEHPQKIKKDIDILGAGSLQPLKRYDLFVKVVDSLRRSIPGIRAEHCGSGEERARLQKMIGDLGLEGNISLLGEKRHGETLALMQRSKILLHTSEYEGFGVVCLEALYAGAQVISFTRPMRADIPGWHIVQTTEEMAAKALEILSDPAPVYTSTLVYAMQDAVRAIMRLYGL